LNSAQPPPPPTLADTVNAEVGFRSITGIKNGWFSRKISEFQ